MKVAIVYHFVPHYREGFVSELDSRKNVSVDWFGSVVGLDNIKVLNSAKFKSFTEIKNYWLRGFLFQPAAVRMAFESKYDCFVFLASPYFVSTWLAALILRFRGARVIYWGHGPQKGKRFFSFVEKFFYDIPDGNFLYGYFGRNNLISLGLKPSKLYVGLNSLKLPQKLNINNGLRLSKGDNPSALTIVALSRLTRACKYDQLVDAASLLKRKYSYDVELIFIGDGECRADLTLQANQLSVKAKFYGAIYDEAAIGDILSGCDLLAQPGKVGLSAMHALSYGLPVVTHNDFKFQMPEVESVIDGVTGLLHRRDDVEDLAYVLSTFHDRFPDVCLLNENCKRMVNVFYNSKRQVDIFLDCVSGVEVGASESVSDAYYEAHDA